MDIALGQIVYSKAGRDRNRRFIVIGIVDGLYVLVADGDLRRIEKPKKKKIKHLELTEETIVTVGEKLKNKLKVTNSEIRKALAVLENEAEGVSKKGNLDG